jgi:septal ring factor EnvC (AmiA/AmiB activator)
MGFSPLYAFGGLLGLGLTLANVKTHRVAAEQAEARRLLLAYAERFQRDCRAAIEDVIRVATDTTTDALQQRIRSALDTLQSQIQTLTKQAAQVQHAETAIKNLERKRATVAKLLTQSQAEISNLSGSGFSAAEARL